MRARGSVFENAGSRQGAKTQRIAHAASLEFSQELPHAPLFAPWRLGVRPFAALPTRLGARRPCGFGTGAV